MVRASSSGATKTYRGALIGCGHVSWFHLTAWSRIEDVEFECPGKAFFLSPDMDKFMGVLSEKFRGRAETEFKEAFPNAACIAVRGGLRLKQKHPEENLEPYYLRPSMAEVTWAKKHGKR